MSLRALSSVGRGQSGRNVSPSTTESRSSTGVSIFLARPPSLTIDLSVKLPLDQQERHVPVPSRRPVPVIAAGIPRADFGTGTDNPVGRRSLPGERPAAPLNAWKRCRCDVAGLSRSSLRAGADNHPGRPGRSIGVPIVQATSTTSDKLRLTCPQLRHSPGSC